MTEYHLDISVYVILSTDTISWQNKVQETITYW